MKKVLICAGAVVVSATIAVGVRAGLKKLREGAGTDEELA